MSKTENDSGVTAEIQELSRRIDDLAERMMKLEFETRHVRVRSNNDQSGKRRLQATHNLGLNSKSQPSIETSSRKGS